MVPENLHDFFIGSAGVAGALIGLLFVAISVAAGRLSEDKDGAQLHRVRAAASLTAFTNALTVSLFALIPGHKVGLTAAVLGPIGLVFVLASLLSLIRQREVTRWRTARDAVFLLGLGVIFVLQMIAGIGVIVQPGNAGDVSTIADLVVVCFLVGIARAWELIGGPNVGFVGEVTALVRDHETRHSAD